MPPHCTTPSGTHVSVRVATPDRHGRSVHHNEIAAGAKRLRDVARDNAAAIGNDLSYGTCDLLDSARVQWERPETAEPVSRVGTLDDGAELRVPDAGLDAGRADRTGADADLDDVGAGQNQLFRHFAGHDVASDNADLRVRLTNASNLSEPWSANDPDVPGCQATALRTGRNSRNIRWQRPGR